MRLPPHRSKTLGINTDFLRRYARKMLRSAHSAHSSIALPVVRRVHAARTSPAGRLTELYHARGALQLKHMFRTLAFELGYASWDACKRDIDYRSPDVLDRFRLDLGSFGDHEHIWFANKDGAADWQRQHGGRMIEYGSQAVIIPG